MLARFSKLIGGVLGLLTPSGLVYVATAYGLHLTDAQSTTILSAVAVVGGLFGVFIAPANAPKTDGEVVAGSMAVREEAALPQFADATSTPLTEE